MNENLYEILIYLLKAGISLAAVYLFYIIVLRRMTFFSWNRWYLLLYSLLALLIPFVNISSFLEKKDTGAGLVWEWIPAVGLKVEDAPVIARGNLDMAGLIFVILLGGILIMSVRFGIQVWSYRQLKKRAERIEGEGTNIYKVDQPILPFSFGRSIFVNPGRHTADEIREIVRHEFVHVNQNHTVDMLWAEWICILNWYNPFAWMIRKAIRQNLEFIADQQVTSSGIDRRQYQYLLLKVMGHHEFQLGSGFNFSSIKTRIAMMNKNKTHRVHLIKFLFAVPVAILLLISFRSEEAIAQVVSPANQIEDADPPPPPPSPAQAGRESTPAPKNIPAPVADTIPASSGVNAKGYKLSIADNEGECVVIVKDKTNKILRAIALTEWNKNPKEFENKYGTIPPPPPPKPADPITVIGYRKTNGTTDSANVLRIRSAETGDEPLYIVDGKIVEKINIKNDLNPEQIESINVLKGEKAIEKYGEKGKNGVLEITLKKSS